MEFSIVLLATFLVTGLTCLWFAFYEDDLMRQRRRMRLSDLDADQQGTVPPPLRLQSQRPSRSRGRRTRRDGQDPYGHDQVEFDRAA